MDASVLLSLAIGYALGSIPFGLIFTRAAGLGDIRAIGSKNIGATNVLRTGRKDIALATLLADALKGTVAVLIARYVFNNDFALLAAAFGAFLGHIFPIWLRFKGGKGVATYIGILAAAYWPLALAFCAVWLVVAFISKYSSLSALIAAVMTPLAIWFTSGPLFAVCFGVMSIILLTKHHSNIRRLLDGTETKIGNKAKPEKIGDAR